MGLHAIIFFFLVTSAFCVENDKPTIRMVKNCFKKSSKPEMEDNRWLYKEMLSLCNIDLICLQDFLQIASKPNTTENFANIQRFFDPGTVFFLPVDKDSPLTWLMADVLNTLSKYNKDPKDYILVHISDETKPPHTGLTELYGKWKQVIRNFWWDEDNFLDYKKKGQLKWYPLGYLTVPKSLPIDKYAIHGSPSNQRPHNLTFLGNKFGNIRRAWHLNEIKKRCNITVYGEVRAHGFRVGNSDAYTSDMLNSKLCLNIRGRMSECYRFYEALEMGCIPVLIDKYDTTDYTSDHLQQYSPLKEVPWRKGVNNMPFIWVKDVAEFAKITNRLLNGGDDRELLQLQKDCAEWWYEVKQYYRKFFADMMCKPRLIV